jgi:hypothetical protein
MGNNPIIWFCTRLVASHHISAGVTMRTERAALTIARITSGRFEGRLALPLCPDSRRIAVSQRTTLGPLLSNKSGGNPKRQADIFTASSVGCRNT